VSERKTRVPDREARIIRDYFAREADRVCVPPAPELPSQGRAMGMLQITLRRVVLASAAAGVILLLASTAGKATTLSQSIDTVFAQYDVNQKITGFLLEAGDLYREGLSGGKEK
jgi:hypothetical protein